MRTHNLSISHSWSHSDQCKRLERLLKEKRHFSFRNHSVPKDDPVRRADSDAALIARIRDKMAPCRAVPVLAGVHASCKWINIEIRFAQRWFESPKPMVATGQWGSQRTSQAVNVAADRIVGRRSVSVAVAIRELAR